MLCRLRGREGEGGREGGRGREGEREGGREGGMNSSNTIPTLDSIMVWVSLLHLV